MKIPPTIMDGILRLVVTPGLGLIDWVLVKDDEVLETGKCAVFAQVAEVQSSRGLPAVIVDDSCNTQETQEAAYHYGWTTYRTSPDLSAMVQFTPNDAGLPQNWGYLWVRGEFVRQMEKELDANAGKGDWEDWRPSHTEIEREIVYHSEKLFAALHRNRRLREGDSQVRCRRVAEYAADVANLCMKAAEIFGAS